MHRGNVANMMVTTTEVMPGYRVARLLGEVLGVTLRTENPYVEGIKGLNGKTNPAATEMLARSREEAVADMMRHARKLGANAVIGMRFDHREIAGGLVEICAYGTAVVAVRDPVDATVEAAVAAAVTEEGEPQPA